MQLKYLHPASYRGLDSLCSRDVAGRKPKRIVGGEEFRVKAKAGVNALAPFGVSIKASGFFDGIGDYDLDAYGGELRLNWPLH